MIVLDANIIIRAILGRRVKVLIETYAPKGTRFFAPDIAFADAEKHLPTLLKKRGLSGFELAPAFEYLRTLIDSIPAVVYTPFEIEARQRLRARDETDWPILATSLALRCVVRTEDSDFFGSGVAVWTTDRVEILLKALLKQTQ